VSLLPSSHKVKTREHADVAVVPVCGECGERWPPADPEREREFIDDGPDDVLRFWCPSCWERELS
jgi:hypothetical protein